MKMSCYNCNLVDLKCAYSLSDLDQLLHEFCSCITRLVPNCNAEYSFIANESCFFVTNTEVKIGLHLLHVCMYTVWHHL